MAEIDSTHDIAGIDAIIHDLRESHANTTAGEWGKGQTTHETVSRHGRDGKYKIADFRHANDAQFCDLAHAFVPRLLNEVEAQAARIAQLDAASKEWHDKTDWLQKDIKPKELGKHRADVLRERIAQLEAQVQALHGEIMNLPARPHGVAADTSELQLAYKMGHRDARHAAAELAAARAAKG